MYYIPIKKEGYKIKVYQFHILKNLYIKPHIHILNMNALL